jgi:hypothetical protein
LNMYNSAIVLMRK